MVASMNSTVHNEQNRQRQRRRIGALGGLFLAGGYIGGNFIAVPRIENNLTDKVEHQLAAKGIADAHVTFSGQDGTIDCATGLTDIAAIKADALKIYGVRTLKLSDSCSAAAAPAPVAVPADTTPAPVAVVTDPPAAAAAISISPVAAIAESGKVVLTGEVATGAQKSQIADAAVGAFGAKNVDDQMTVAAAGGDTAVSDSLAKGLSAMFAAFPDKLISGEAGVQGDALYLKGVSADAAALTALTGAATAAGAKVGDVALKAPASPAAAAAMKAAATLADGRITLEGTVATDAHKKALGDAAASVVGAANVSNNLLVQSDLAADQANVDGLVALISAMPPNLVSGESGFDGKALYAKGVYVSDATKAAFEAASSGVGVTPSLQARPEGSADDAAALQKQLNDYVVANPIQFDSNQATLTPAANVIVDQVAVYAKKLAGVKIEVQGHTDNQGSAARNLTLSQNRAKAVVDALVSRGVPADQLTAKGYGLTVPKVANDTPENKALNRRVEFAVTTA